MSEMHSRQSEFTYSACGLFTKNKEKTEKIKELGDVRYTSQNKLDKACFQRDIDHGEFQNSPRRNGSNKLLRDKGFNMAKNSKYDGCQGRLVLMVYKFFYKKSSATNKGAVSENNN